ncbi:MAG TPA: hypothetical protein VM141_13150 [Planctomycetota bacterium]|nr:hypothetical protein [Planctomycetota bacterium]
MKQCYNCGWEWKQPQVPAFREMCPRCDSFLHCCKNCSLYDESANQKCKSSTVDKIREKDRSNFCEEFKFKEVATAKIEKTRKAFSTGKPEEKLDPREKFRRLFNEE